MEITAIANIDSGGNAFCSDCSRSVVHSIRATEVGSGRALNLCSPCAAWRPAAEAVSA